MTGYIIVEEDKMGKWISFYTDKPNARWSFERDCAAVFKTEAGARARMMPGYPGLKIRPVDIEGPRPPEMSEEEWAGKPEKQREAVEGIFDWADTLIRNRGNK